MASHQLDEERIFHLARKQPDADAQSEYLAQICAGDQALRARVEALLEIHEKERRFLRSNIGPSSTEAIADNVATTGEQIGRYKLLQKIGEGGFGVVFMAEQHRPVRRKVAVKVIKPGMDTKGVVARFEAERQALAMMDHPNIAKVLDGGATESGRPYFVMELVKGVPITDYCDQNQLSAERRLKLFITICQAVQHAHQKGIIHRDLKPSNVLVTLADGEPIVKVIDFGVAKATNQQLTEKTLFTAYGQMVGTPQYMSPEQAEMSCLDVDTRSDVYSLGVLLYELLTGTTPLKGERLRSAGYAELQRLIKEEEPPKPSTRLSTAGETLTAIARHRAVSPERLKHQVEGDLDWIVMKALEKDRNRRYDAPTALAQDIANYLADSPVIARPPTFQYRTAKFLRRNRITVGAALLILAALSVGLIGTIRQSRIARIAGKEAIQNAVKLREEKELRERALREIQTKHQQLILRTNRLRDVFIDQAITAALIEDQLTVKEAIENAVSVGADPAWRTVLDGLLADYRGEHEQAVRLLKDAVHRDPTNVVAQGVLASAYWNLGQIDDHEACVMILQDLTPKNRFDALFSSYARRFWDSTPMVDSLSGLVANRTSWGAAHMMLADAKAWNAWDRGDLSIAISALNDIRLAKQSMSGSTVMHRTEILVLIAALDLAPDDDSRRSLWIARAEEAASALESPQSRNHWEVAAWRYFVGDSEAALSALGNNGGFMHKSFRNALLMGLERYEDVKPAGILVWESKSQSEAIALAKRDIADNTSYLWKIWLPIDLYAVGGEEEAKQEWEGLLSQSDSFLWNQQYPLFLFSERWSPEELLADATESESRFRLFFAHNCLGHYYLYINQDREKAIHHFKMSLDYGPCASEAYVWAQSYHDLLVNDESWPWWIK